MSESASGEANSDTTGSNKDVWVCDDCGKEYESRQGLEYHYKTHTTDCAGMPCPDCESSHFVTRFGLVRHYGREHGGGLSEYPRLADEEWYRQKYIDEGLTTTEIAELCGASLPTTREWKRNHGIENIDAYKSRGTGEDNPTWTENTEQTNCVWCGESIEIREMRVERADNNFCDYECQANYVSTHRIGENHPLYEGGEHYYGSKWRNEVRPRIRERDNYTCQACGVHESDMDRELDVHHLTPANNFDNLSEAHDPDNLICFCRSCHQRWEGIPLRPERGE